MGITGKQIEDGTIPGSKLLGSVESQSPKVIDKDLVTSPGPGLAGDKYIIAGTGGSWSGGTINDIAEDLDGLGTTWDFVTPTAGDEVWVLDEEATYRFDGSDWLFQLGVDAAGASLLSPGGLLTINGIGIFFAEDSTALSNVGNLTAAQIVVDPALSGGGFDGNIVLADSAGAGVDEKFYSLKALAGVLSLEALDDSFVATDILTITRTGVVVDAITITTPLLALQGEEPAFSMSNTGGDVDEKIWLLQAGAAQLKLVTADDSGSEEDGVIIIERVGTNAGSITVGPNDELVLDFNQADDTEPVLTLRNSGTFGGTSATYIGGLDPTGNGVGNAGDYYKRVSGADSAKYLHDGTDWNLLAPSASDTVHGVTSTGVVDGGVLSLGSGAPDDTFSISDGFGFVVDNTTTPSTPSSTKVTWSGLTDITVTDIGTQLITFVSINSAGTVIQRGTKWTRAQQRDEILLGVVVHVDNATVNALDHASAAAINIASQVGDLFEGLGFLNVSGNLFSPNGANLNINKSIGVLMNRGVAWDDDPKNPNHKTLAALVAASFQYRFQDGTNGATGTAIDPDIYDVGGTSTAVPVNQWTIQRAYVFTAGNVIIQPGQETYGNQAEAVAAIQTEAFVTEPSIAANGLLRAFIVVQEGATDLSDPVEAFFLNAGKFGETAGAGGLSVSTLQGAYDNSSSNPEIDTTDAGGPLTLRRGTTGGDGDTVQEVQNAAGTQVFGVTGEGVLLGLAAPKVVQARRTTDYILTTAFGDVTLDTTDIETDSTVLDHDLATNSDNIIIGVTGVYELYFLAEGILDGTQAGILARIRVNDTTVVPGSTTPYGGDSHNQQHNYMLSKRVLVSLTAGDFVTLQLASAGGGVGNNTAEAEIIFSAVRL